MKIEVRVMPVGGFNESCVGWSEPVPIEEFITDPHNVQFEWGEECVLPYNDFIFYGSDYCYGIFINDEHINVFKKHIASMQEIVRQYEELCK